MGIVKNLRGEITKLRRIIQRRAYISAAKEKNIVDQFHQFYYDSSEIGNTWKNTTWLGKTILKCPFDMWIYQEIIFEQKPDLIIETGTYQGGSAFYMATLCDMIGHGKIVSIDINPEAGRPQHPRIEYVTGSSTASEHVDYVKKQIGKEFKVMVILDSDHSKKHVLDEMRIYNKLVTKGCYMIVEDSNINGHPVFPEFGPGPMEAIQEFMKENNDFMIDKDREKFFVSFNPSGYLKKVN